MSKGIYGGVTGAATAAGFALWQMWLPNDITEPTYTDLERHTERSDRQTVNCDAPTANDEELAFLDVLVEVRVIVTETGELDPSITYTTPEDIQADNIEILNAILSHNSQQFNPNGNSRVRFSPYLFSVTNGVSGLTITEDHTEGGIVWDRGLAAGAGGREEWYGPARFDPASPAYIFSVQGIYGGAHSGGESAVMAYYNAYTGIAVHEFGHIALPHTHDNTDPTVSCDASNAYYCDLESDPNHIQWSQSAQDGGTTGINYDSGSDAFSWQWSQLGLNPGDSWNGYTIEEWDVIPYTNVMSYYFSTYRHFTHEQMIDIHNVCETTYKKLQPASLQLYDTLSAPDVLAVYYSGDNETEISWPKVWHDYLGHVGFVDYYEVFKNEDFENPVAVVDPLEQWDTPSWKIRVSGDLSGLAWSIVPMDNTEGFTYEYTAGEWWDYTGEGEPVWTRLGSWTSEFDDPATRGGCGWTP